MAYGPENNPTLRVISVQLVPLILFNNLSDPPATNNPLPYATTETSALKLPIFAPVQVVPVVLVATRDPPPTATHNPDDAFFYLVFKLFIILNGIY